MIKTYNKTKESEYIDIINSFKLPEEVLELIQQYTFDANIFKKQWLNRMIESLSIIDKGYKLIPTYYIYNKKYFCCECYLESFIKKTTYISNKNCFCCECYIDYIDLITTNLNIVINYESVSYKEMLKLEELNTIFKLYKCDISVILKSSKLLSEYVILNKSSYYITKFIKSGLKYEITIPLYWKTIHKKITYSNL